MVARELKESCFWGSVNNSADVRPVVRSQCLVWRLKKQVRPVNRGSAPVTGGTCLKICKGSFDGFANKQQGSKLVYNVDSQRSSCVISATVQAIRRRRGGRKDGDRHALLARVSSAWLT